MGGRGHSKILQFHREVHTERSISIRAHLHYIRYKNGYFMFSIKELVRSDFCLVKLNQDKVGERSSLF